jgi:hypothetical protein
LFYEEAEEELIVRSMILILRNAVDFNVHNPFHRGNDMTKRLIKAAWFLLAAIILVTTLYFFDGKPNSDVEDFLVFTMIPLTFPSGYLLVGILGLIIHAAYRSFGFTYATSYVSLLIEWLGLFSAGYFQWFYLLPWFIELGKKVKSKREKQRE